VAEKGSFISRFFYKLLEIMGAAVATAVSGYLVAHLGGFLPSQTHAPATPRAPGSKECSCQRAGEPARAAAAGDAVRGGPRFARCRSPDWAAATRDDGFSSPTGPQDGEGPAGAAATA
jgi:hypothetical protein